MQFFGMSDRGKKRPENQDSFVTEQLCDNAILCLVCDGMGGANGGSTASSLAGSVFLENIRKSLSALLANGKVEIHSKTDDKTTGSSSRAIENIIKKAAEEANTAVFKKAAKNKELAGMGTTLVGALIIDGVLFAFNIGDSRLYFVLPEGLRQITKDHSYVQTLIDLGHITREEALTNPHKNIITKAVGISKSETPDLFTQPLDTDKPDYLLLCSDGLTNYASEEKIHSIIKANDDIEKTCSSLIDEANKNGGGDNITVVLIKLNEQAGGEAE